MLSLKLWWSLIWMKSDEQIAPLTNRSFNMACGSIVLAIIHLLIIQNYRIDSAKLFNQLIIIFLACCLQNVMFSLLLTGCLLIDWYSTTLPSVVLIECRSVAAVCVWSGCCSWVVLGKRRAVSDDHPAGSFKLFVGVKCELVNLGVCHWFPFSGINRQCG